MSIRPLQTPVEWGYDDATGQVVMRLRERPPPDHPDPANFVPAQEYVVRLDIASVTVKDLT